MSQSLWRIARLSSLTAGVALFPLATSANAPEKFPLAPLARGASKHFVNSAAPHRESGAWQSSLFGLIDVHQRYISPADGPRSHFAPVSSTYARGAMRRFGWGGIFLVFDRLMRENDERWIYQIVERDETDCKVDPVPQARAP